MVTAVARTMEEKEEAKTEVMAAVEQLRCWLRVCLPCWRCSACCVISNCRVGAGQQGLSVDYS